MSSSNSASEFSATEITPGFLAASACCEIVTVICEISNNYSVQNLTPGDKYKQE
jgi:hypothetical protein